MRQANRETKRSQRNKKDKMLLLFNKIGKGCILDKSRKVLVIEAVYNSYKSIFYFFDNLRAFHEIFSGKVYFVNYIIPVLN